MSVLHQQHMFYHSFIGHVGRNVWSENWWNRSFGPAAGPLLLNVTPTSWKDCGCTLKHLWCGRVWRGGDHNRALDPAANQLDHMNKLPLVKDFCTKSSEKQEASWGLKILFWEMKSANTDCLTRKSTQRPIIDHQIVKLFCKPEWKQWPEKKNYLQRWIVSISLGGLRNIQIVANFLILWSRLDVFIKMRKLRRQQPRCTMMAWYGGIIGASLDWYANQGNIGPSGGTQLIWWGEEAVTDTCC